MNLNKRELKWLQRAIEKNDEYHIAVDNDCVSVDVCVDEDNDL